MLAILMILLQELFLKVKFDYQFIYIKYFLDISLPLDLPIKQTDHITGKKHSEFIYIFLL